jgi:hypothetical protein
VGEDTQTSNSKHIIKTSIIHSKHIFSGEGETGEEFGGNVLWSSEFEKLIEVFIKFKIKIKQTKNDR